jgi:excisionase family DNA binding protein
VPEYAERIAPIERETLKAEQAALLLGISYWKLNEMCKAGKIPHFLVGNRRIFRRSTLESWMENQERLSIQIDSRGLTVGRI